MKYRKFCYKGDYKPFTQYKRADLIAYKNVLYVYCGRGTKTMLPPTLDKRGKKLDTISKNFTREDIKERITFY